MSTVSIHTPKSLKAIREVLKGRLPGIGIDHIDEAVASGLGFRHRAAALAALKAAPLTAEPDGAVFSARLAELTENDPGPQAANMFAFFMEEVYAAYFATQSEPSLMEVSRTLGHTSERTTGIYGADRSVGADPTIERGAFVAGMSEGMWWQHRAIGTITDALENTEVGGCMVALGG